MEAAAHDAEDHCIPEETWEKLLGSNSWEGLLDPLDLNLRKFILRCGDLLHAAYDAFLGKGADNATTTFHHVKLPDCCKFHSHLYATPSLKVLERFLEYLASKSGRRPTTEHVPAWMGYCAVTARSETGGRRRVIYILWRGTKRLFEWRNNFAITRVSAECLLRNSNEKTEKTPRVMKGWLSIYTSNSSRVKKSARDRVKAAVEELYGKDRSEEEKISVVVAGHSLGGILAILTAFDIVENLVGEDVQVAAVVFGCPRVGNRAFRERVKRHPNLNVLHVRNKKDVITHLPPARRIGTELVVDSRKSDIQELSQSKNIGLRHDLETYLYMVAGWNGKDNGFELKVNRSTERLMKATKAFEYNRGEIEKFFSQIKNKFFKRIMDKFLSTNDHSPSSDSESSDEEEANVVPTKLK